MNGKGAENLDPTIREDLKKLNEVKQNVKRNEEKKKGAIKENLLTPEKLEEMKKILLIWRVKDLRMVTVPEKHHGEFFRGDCYIILNPSFKPNNKGQVIHYFIGDNSSNDEKFVAAYQAIELDEYFDGPSTQIREIEGSESPEFVALFKNGTRKYNNGGYESMLKNISNIVYVPHLYRVKGKSKCQVTEVECNIKLMRSDDCYVLDSRAFFFVLKGRRGNRYEKRKANQTARNIRDEFGGRGEIIFIDEDDLCGLYESVLRKLFKLTASNKLEFGNPLSTVDSDEEFEKQVIASTELYKISNESGQMIHKRLESAEQSMLNTNDCFILKTTAGKVTTLYIWNGTFANKSEKRSAHEYATEFIKKEGLKSSTMIRIVPEHVEPEAFKNCFPNWKTGSGQYVRPSNIAKSVNTKVDVASLYAKKAGAKDMYADDEKADGDLKIYRIDLDDPDEVSEPCSNPIGFVFNSGDAYVLTYTYTNRTNTKKHIVYYWIGKHSEILESGTAAKVAVRFDERVFNSLAVQAQVLQEREPPHFMRLFRGKIIIKNAELGKDRQLFHVRAKQDHSVKVVQVEVDASNLNSNDCFILNCKYGIFLWYGRGSTGDEHRVSREASAEMYPVRGVQGSYVIAGEGNEPAEFWEGIGGKKKYLTEYIPADSQNEEEPHEPRLFHCAIISGANIEVTEVLDFDQLDLIADQDDVMLLDAYYCVYVWVGKDASREEKIQAKRLAREYVDNDPTRRTHDDVFLLLVHQGCEPDEFKYHFGMWDDDLLPSSEKNLENEEITAAKDFTAVKDEDFIKPNRKYSCTELRRPDLPEDVIPEFKELYLTDKEFEATFGMTHESFKKLPKWKKEQMKKGAKLF